MGLFAGAKKLLLVLEGTDLPLSHLSGCRSGCRLNELITQGLGETKVEYLEASDSASYSMLNSENYKIRQNISLLLC